MKRLLDACAGFMVLLAGSLTLAADDYPAVQLDNGALRMRLYLPDAQRGFYRGTRFDWSGLIARIDRNGHTFYGPWRQPHDPTGHDFVTGPTDEFGMQTPLGFSEATPGQSFIKIGIGRLRKTDDPAYSFRKTYAIVHSPAWKIEKTPASIEFRQILPTENGYGYDYTKQVTLTETPPGFLLVRTLRNTGTKPIATNHYNHNFTMIDDDPIGPAYRLDLPFTPALSEKEPPTMQNVGALRNQSLIFTAPVDPARPLWCALTGFRELQHNAFTIRNTRSNAALHASGDYPLTRLAFYAASTAICPEPFTEFTLQPNEQKRWTTRYILEAPRK